MFRSGESDTCVTGTPAPGKQTKSFSVICLCIVIHYVATGNCRVNDNCSYSSDLVHIRSMI